MLRDRELQATSLVSGGVVAGSCWVLHTTLSASESRQDAEYGRALDALVKAVRGVSATRAQLVCPALPAFVGAGSVALGHSH